MQVNSVEIASSQISNEEKKQQVTLEAPGRLESQASIMLQTRIAQGYFKGRHQGSPGLLKFSSKMLMAKSAAAKDDPYADLILLKVEKSFAVAKKRFKQLEIKYKKLLEVGEGMEVLPSVSAKPLKIPLRFGSAYGFQAALLLRDFDQLARHILTAHYFGLLEEEVGIVLREAGNYIRQIFQIPQQWQFTGVTRKDFIDNNQVANRAKELMGDINEKILKSEVKGRYSPLLKPHNLS